MPLSAPAKDQKGAKLTVQSSKEGANQKKEKKKDDA
jgi:hypothetical protein